MKATAEQIWIQAAAWTATYVGIKGEDPNSGLDAFAVSSAPLVRDAITVLSVPDPQERAALLVAERRALLVNTDDKGDSTAQIERFSHIGGIVIASLIVATPVSIRAALARSFAPEALRAATLVTAQAVGCDPIALRSLTEQIAIIEKHPPQAATLGALVVACFSTTEQKSVLSETHQLLRSLRARGTDVRRALHGFETVISS